ncbi:DUF5685 family protein [Anaerovorax odorimutans]|uniref:DUF5685 family protein n=1 Tax=Anaerovorax odorimutans TaxID=109327 RepID=UPI00041017B2|nr:DUF5685 family protein [Anaerovorax odorimutans]
MLGYILPEKPELKVREYEMYSGYYCGICKSIGKRYGQIPRFTLSYDSVLLALILGGINSDAETIRTERCIVNPLKKRNIVYDNKAIDYAADLMLILAYFKLKDDFKDEKKITAALGSVLMKSSFKKILKNRSEKCNITKERLTELSILEKDNCDNIDPAAEPFAKLMEEVFDGESIFAEDKENDENVRLAFRKMGYHLGKWIYLIDAFDDIEDNAKNKVYNPLINQFKYDYKSKETIEEFKARIANRVEFNLMCYLAEVAKAYENLNIKKNKGLIENIIYFGLHRKTEEVLGINKSTDEKGE